MYVCIKKDLEKNISIVGDIDNMDIGYVDVLYEKYDCVADEEVKELTDELAEELKEEGILYEL